MSEQFPATILRILNITSQCINTFSKFRFLPRKLFLYHFTRFLKGTPCGPEPNVTEKNAITQYTVTEQGITAAYVCNDGFLWKDGAVMKQDVRDDGALVHNYNDTALREDGCAGQ